MTTEIWTEERIQDQRDWLMERKESSGLSWRQLGQQVGIPEGTLSQFGPGTYMGNNQRVAETIARYRAHELAQAEIEIEAPEIPDFFDTPTTRQINALLRWGHRGRMTVIAGGPGIGKTKAARRYRDSATNVFMATMAPSTRGVQNMQIELLKALGDNDANGTPQKLTHMIRERVRGRGALLIFDEAQHLSEQAVEEIRGWHDAEGVGIALLGNIGLLARLEGGSRKAAFAQLYSRVGQRMVRNLPLQEDILALAAAWGIQEPKLIHLLLGIGRKPGGLRSCTMALENAAMLAAVERKPMAVTHLADAWAQLSTRPVVE